MALQISETVPNLGAQAAEAYVRLDGINWYHGAKTFLRLEFNHYFSVDQAARNEDGTTNYNPYKTTALTMPYDKEGLAAAGEGGGDLAAYGYAWAKANHAAFSDATDV